jgi:hypothetical protein
MLSLQQRHSRPLRTSVEGPTLEDTRTPCLQRYVDTTDSPQRSAPSKRDEHASGDGRGNGNAACASCASCEGTAACWEDFPRRLKLSGIVWDGLFLMGCMGCMGCMETNEWNRLTDEWLGGRGRGATSFACHELSAYDLLPSL